MPNHAPARTRRAATTAPSLQDDDPYGYYLMRRFPGVHFSGIATSSTKIGRSVHIAAGAWVNLWDRLKIKGRTRIGPRAVISGPVAIYDSSIDGEVFDSDVAESYVAHGGNVNRSMLSETTIHTGGKVIGCTLRRANIFKGGIVFGGEHEYVFVDNYQVTSRVAKYVCYRPSPEHRSSGHHSDLASEYEGYLPARGSTVSEQVSAGWPYYSTGYPMFDVPFEGPVHEPFRPRPMTTLPPSRTSTHSPEHGQDLSRRSRSERPDDHEQARASNRPPRGQYTDTEQATDLNRSSIESGEEQLSGETQGRNDYPSSESDSYELDPRFDEQNAMDERVVCSTWAKMARNESEKYDCEVPPIFMDRSITYDMIHDAVFTPNGDIYDRAVIEHWIACRHSDPKTRRPLFKEDLVPFRGLNEMIEEWKNEHVIKGSQREKGGEDTEMRGL